ncbi:MAG: polyamine aminopropyltransferase [Chloroflexi bacterium]|nr:polyamine aminopropyltransferase [Chloroflexota bacterium]
MIPGKSKWYFEPITPDLLHGVSIRKTLYTGATRYQAVEVLESGAFGRMLVLDGKTQSAELDEFVYHEGLVHPALLTHPRPESVFIGGGGEGATAREVLRHPGVRQVAMVDLDSEVVDLCRQWLPQHHQGAFEDPRLRLHVADARAYLEQTAEHYDVMVLDLPDPLEGGPAYQLYTEEFYRLVRTRLRPGGVMVTQSGPASVVNCREVFTAIHNTLERVFPVVAPYAVHMMSFGETWGFNVASLAPDPRTLVAREIDLRLAQDGVSGLRFYDGTTHLGLFAIPRFLRDALSAEDRAITLEHPLFVF